MVVNILNLPDWTVTALDESDPEVYRVHARYDLEPAFCPRCGVVSPKVRRFGKRENVFADLPHHGRRTEIVVERQRYECGECGAVFTEALPDIDDRHRATKRLVTWVGEQAIRRPFTQVAHDTQVSEKTVRRIFALHVEELEAKRQVVTPAYLGIDEIHLIGKPRCILTNVDVRTVVDLLEDRNKPLVVRYLQQLPDRERVEVVAMDMWRPYKEAVNAVLPQAEVVVDRFHVVRMATNSMEAVRKAVRKGLNSRQRVTLKNDRWLLLRRARDLKPHQRMVVEAWGAAFPELVRAWETKEAFYEVYDSDTREEAAERLEAWQEGVPKDMRPYFKPLLTATRNWEHEILAYFEHRITNAYTESLNNLIRMTHRLGRGYSFEALRAKILYATPRKAKPEPEAKPAYLEAAHIRPWQDTGAPLENMIILTAEEHARFNDPEVINHLRPLIQQWLGDDDSTPDAE